MKEIDEEPEFSFKSHIEGKTDWQEQRRKLMSGINVANFQPAEREKLECALYQQRSGSAKPIQDIDFKHQELPIKDSLKSRIWS